MITYIPVCTSIKVKAEFRAQHRWADCPFEEVAFLREWHRHVFHVEIDLWVTHGDRDEEFFMVQHRLRTCVGQWEGKQVEKSCEMFAEAVLIYFSTYNVRSVTVSEDGENSGTITVDPSWYQPVPRRILL